MSLRLAFDWRWIALGFALALAGSAVAADPGSRDDPLITVGYARYLSTFQRRELPTGTAVNLPPGGELVLVKPDSGPVNAAGLSPDRHTLINLSSGERVIVTALRANQHYVNAGSSELSLRFDAATTVLVRGAGE